ncbi:response regulator [Sphingomonas sanguinis]|uniref:Response regulator n=1 Tax=Sphingomonas sanguinis TaxID=33051 RepID=A0ABU5LN11_9SPHN|nr:response regulator [Sphingomonas sanguinis]MDZ7281319.1 response regulator [Sphingomonas sanguinis]
MCHVLIIEDEPFIAMSIQSMLEAEGATSFDFAVTQQEAVAVALKRPPEVITSDVKLVEGTGPLAVAEIHERLGFLPVIFISATPDECRPCSPPGIVLAKPVRESELRRAFRQIGMNSSN